MLTYWAVVGINCSNSQRRFLGKLYGNRLVNRYNFGFQKRPLLEKQQTGEFAAVNDALAPVVVKAFVVIGMHVCEKEGRSLWGSPVVYGNCHTSTLQNIAVRHDLQYAEAALGPPVPVSKDTGTACIARFFAEREELPPDGHRKP